jgi:CRISPR-associated protein Csb2
MRVDGPKLPPASVQRLSQIVRKAVLELYPDPIPEVVSGHAADGTRSAYPHLAITPLLDVGHRYADGHVMGFALWVPSNIPAEVVEQLETSLANLETVTLGHFGLWKVRQVTAEQSNRAPLALRQDTYSRTHELWASVTPVVFGKFPKKYKTGPGKDGGNVFAEMCALIGLPKPIEVRLAPVSVFAGAPTAFECLPSTRFTSRFKSHVIIRFAEPVKGPVVLGVGRYQGFGLCRPWLASAGEL